MAIAKKLNMADKFSFHLDGRAAIDRVQLIVRQKVAPKLVPIIIIGQDLEVVDSLRVFTEIKAFYEVLNQKRTIREQKKQNLLRK
jgi:hypothetical protein